jgi:signal transduction histidine kinase
MGFKKGISFAKRNAFTISMVAVAFLIAAMLGAYFVNLSYKNIRSTAQEKLRLESNVFLSFSTQHFLAGVQELRSAGGFFAGSENVNRQEFYRFIEASRFLEEYPGFQTFGYAPLVARGSKEEFITSVAADTSVNANGYPDFAISPEGDRAQYLPLTYIYPEEEVAFLMGLDSYADEIRTENANRARDFGDPSVSGLVQLGEGGIGVIVTHPVYDAPEIPKTLADRRRLFKGVLTTVIDSQKFFNYVLDFSNIASSGITASMTGRTGTVYPIYTHPEPVGVLSRLYGTIRLESALVLTDTTYYIVLFTAPVSALVSFQDLIAPFLYAFIFFGTAIFMSAVIIISQRSRTISEFKQRYSFISTLSHQLRTPLTRLRWAAESIKVAKKQKEMYNHVLEEGSVLRSIIDRLLTYIEVAGKVNLEKHQVSIKAFCAEVFGALSLAERKRVVCEGSETSDLLVGDVKKLLQAIMYMVNNGLTYSKPSSSVYLRVLVENSRMKIKIKDTGYGIPVKDQGQVFQEFFRASNASLGKNAGSGVSLYIAKKIIEAHGGDILFTSREGKGSEFVVDLPLVLTNGKA